MITFREIVRRLMTLIRPRRFDRDLRDEMALHVDLRTAREAERGVAPDEARRRANRAFGAPLRLREDARDAWGWLWIDHTARDIRFALRALGRTPAFTAGAVLSLTLGLAIAACAVAVTNAYLIRSLPYPAGERVYHVMYAPPGPWEPTNLSRLDWTTVNDVVEFPIVSAAETLHLTDGTVTSSLRARRVTYGVVAGLDVHMTAGRLLVENDFRGGSDPAALIGYNVWRDRFGSSPDAIGRQLLTETEAGRPQSLRIAGVLPPNFFIGGESRQPIDAVLPLTTPVRTYYMIRLRRGVPPSLVESRLTEAVRQVATDLPADWSGVHLESARERYAGEFRPVLIGVTTAAALVLVIVFANVAVLMVLRIVRRQKEVGVRLALGSSRGRLARMLATETCLISAAALGIGLLVTHVALGLLGPLIETQLGRPAPGGTATIAVDTTVLAVVGATGLVVALGLSFVPLLLSRRGGLADVLRRTATATTDGRSMRRLRSGMLAFEVAITLLLLVGCGLMVRSVVAMVRTDLGFQPEQLARARIALRAADYPDAAAFSRFYDQFTRRASTATGLPVVFSSWPAFFDFPEHAIEVDGRDGYVLNAGAVNVGPGYFGTLGIALRRGRDVTWDDVTASAPVAVVSESLARRLWPDGSAIGKQLRQIEVTAGGPRPPGPWQTVVGVSTDVRQKYGDTNLNDIYTPWIPDLRFGSFFIRSAGENASLLPSLRRVAGEIDPRAVVDLFHPVHEDNRELAGTTFLSIMLASFAGVAAFIAVLGIYAVTAYAAQQREREVAIRMALGAGRNSVVWLFLREGSVVLAAGLALGLIAAVAASRVLEHHVFAVTTFDRATLVSTCVLLASSCLIATWWPARRASRRNPTVALKDV
jgi:predicted permease